MPDGEKHGVVRISVSLPEQTLAGLDDLVAHRGFGSRSGAIAEMVNRQIAEHSRDVGEGIMAGTINLVYDHTAPGLQRRLRALQHEYIDEVISSLNVYLVHSQTLEVILVQGPAGRLEEIANRMITSRGVISGKLLMSAAILPPVHPLSAVPAAGGEHRGPAC